MAARDLNRELSWELPVDGPTTVSGIIIEFLETIPDGKVCCMLNNYRIEVTKYKENKIENVIIKRIEQNKNIDEEA